MEEKLAKVNTTKALCPQKDSKVCPKPNECDGVHRLCDLPKFSSSR